MVRSPEDSLEALLGPVASRNLLARNVTAGHIMVLLALRDLSARSRNIIIVIVYFRSNTDDSKLVFRRINLLIIYILILEQTIFAERNKEM